MLNAYNELEKVEGDYKVDDTLEVADGLGEGGYASYYVYENGVGGFNTTGFTKYSPSKFIQ